MIPIFAKRISILMAKLFVDYARSMPSVGLFTCSHCGSVVNARVEDGMCVFDSTSDSRRQNWLRFRHVVALTSDGKLSIFCASERSDSTASPDSGRSAGIFSSITNRDE